jgi:hypothetical protein
VALSLLLCSGVDEVTDSCLSVAWLSELGDCDAATPDVSRAVDSIGALYEFADQDMVGPIQSDSNKVGRLTTSQVPEVRGRTDETQEKVNLVPRLTHRSWNHTEGEISLKISSSEVEIYLLYIVMPFN